MTGGDWVVANNLDHKDLQSAREVDLTQRDRAAGIHERPISQTDRW
jgi:hypothetical protein